MNWDGNIFSHGDKWKYPAITKPGEMLSPCGLKPLLKMTSVSLGGLVRSGKVTDLDQNFDPLPQEDFRKVREPMNYRVDASYTYKKEFRTGRLLLFRAGLYNIVDFYSVHWHRNCLPYGSISFKF